MISRPLVAGVLTGWVVGDPAMGLLVGGVLELYFIPVFPVGGSEFPEGGPSTVVAVALASAVGGPAGVAIGTLLGFLWTRLGGISVTFLREANARMVPDPADGTVAWSRLVLAHFGGMTLDFVRGGVLTLAGLLVAGLASEVPAEAWPLSLPGTLGLLAVGASLPVGGYLTSVGGWRKRGALFGAGMAVFLALGLIL